MIMMVNGGMISPHGSCSLRILKVVQNGGRELDVCRQRRIDVFLVNERFRAFRLVALFTIGIDGCPYRMID